MTAPTRAGQPRLLAALCLAALVCGCSPARPELGFWFEPLSFRATALGGPLTGDDLLMVEATAQREIARAFASVPASLSSRRDARYRVRVVQELQDLRSKHFRAGPAGQSYAVAGFGGSGAVSFAVLAGNAIGYAPPDATRDALIAAIGRGVGRAAVHEFAHELLPRAPIDSSRDVASYEYGYAARPEQYWGDLRWSLALPLLQRRFGSAPPLVR